MSKKWYASKTIWTNLVGGLAMLATVSGVEVLNAEAQASLVAGIMVIANLYLRFVTKEPIG